MRNTEYKKAEKNKAEDRYRLALEGANLGVWDWDISNGRVKYNKVSMEMLGYKEKEIEPTIDTWKKLIHPDDKKIVLSILEKHIHGESNKYHCEYRIKTKDGLWKWILDAGEVVDYDRQGRPLRAIGIHQDIDQIKYLSYHDQLTGLYNRRYFQNELEKLDSSRRLPVGIIVADLDYLKYINDRFGHKEGDKYISEAALAIKRSVRKEDIAARIGGDEFAILLPSVDEEISEKILIRIDKEFNNLPKNNEKYKHISMGFALKKSIHNRLEDIMNSADRRMYINKENYKATHLGMPGYFDEK